MITVIEAILNLVLSIALVGRYGTIGVAIGTTLPMLLIRGALYPIVVRDTLGIGVREYYGMYLRPLLVGAVYLAVVSRLAWVPMTSYLRFVGLAAASTIVFAAIVPIAVPEVGALLLKRLRFGAGTGKARQDLPSSSKSDTPDGQAASHPAD